MSPGLGRSPGEGNGNPLQYYCPQNHIVSLNPHVRTFESKAFGRFPGGSDDKASAYNAGDLGLIPGSGRSPGEGNGIPL